MPVGQRFRCHLEPLRQRSRDGGPGSRIAAVDIFELNIPFSDFGEGTDATPIRWSSLEKVLVRITLENGLQGWGECFAYGCRSAVSAAMRDMVKPLLMGQNGGDPEGLLYQLQRKLHIFGRYGITIFALSGVDIALWDIKAKIAGLPLASLLAPKPRIAVPAYASLVHYGSETVVAAMAERALAKGYASIKLHEKSIPIIRKARRSIGRDTHLTIDLNCAFTLEQIAPLLPDFEEIAPAWLEEPIFPPEDLEALQALSTMTNIPLAAGENSCTRVQFRAMMRSGALKVVQPSVTKVGGVTEALAILAAVQTAPCICMMHSPYFGPGYFATVHLLAADASNMMLEYHYTNPAGFTGRNTPLPDDGHVAVPTTPGLGFEPDWDVFERFSTSASKNNSTIA